MTRSRVDSLISLARFGLLVALVVGASSTCEAAVVISSGTTANISCVGGVCTPTKKNAVLNVTALQNLLAAGGVVVTTAGSKSSDILVSANLSWASSYSLSLDAFHSITINKSVAVDGTGSLTLTTDDGGTGGALSFGSKGHVTFLSTANNLTINGGAYTLVGDTTTLANDVAASPSGNFALAGNYDATSNSSFVATTFTGNFEGLGNTISHLSINSSAGNVGLFAEVGSQGVVENLILTGLKIVTGHGQELVGGLAGTNNGSLVNDSTSGGISLGDSYGGGLVGMNSGQISDCHSSANVAAKDGKSFEANSVIGGLVGYVNSGTITDSYASGYVKGSKADTAGGLAGTFGGGVITNSYSTGTVSSQGGDVGGLVGASFGIISYSYSTGGVSSPGGTSGGLIGFDSGLYAVSDSYWDTTTSGIANSSQGAGNKSNDPGITGLSTSQLQAGLPVGFSNTIWTEVANINGGLPYLIALPPA